METGTRVQSHYEMLAKKKSDIWKLKKLPYCKAL